MKSLKCPILFHVKVCNNAGQGWCGDHILWSPQRCRVLLDDQSTISRIWPLSWGPKVMAPVCQAARRRRVYGRKRPSVCTICLLRKSETLPGTLWLTSCWLKLCGRGAGAVVFLLGGQMPPGNDRGYIYDYGLWRDNSVSDTVRKWTSLPFKMSLY